MFFNVIMTFLAKTRKVCKFGKIRNFEEEYFFERKSFHIFNRHIEQNWRAENMPMVASCLVKA